MCSHAAKERKGKKNCPATLFVCKFVAFYMGCFSGLLM